MNFARLAVRGHRLRPIIGGTPMPRGGRRGHGLGEEGEEVRGLDVTAQAQTEQAAGANSKEAIPLHEWVHIVVIAGKAGTRV